MSFNNINTKLRSERGFTIVELLIVIVVIGILAAITIVSFNGVTARANTSSAQSAAATTIKKIEAFNAEKSGYPTAYSGPGNLTDSASQSNSYYLSGVTVANAALSAKPDPVSTVNIFKCVNSGSTTIVGMQVKYWKFDTSGGTAAGLQTLSTGDTSGTCSILTS